MTRPDPILKEMAKELREALVKAGLDPKNPPPDPLPPTMRAFDEYINRGGTKYTTRNLFIKDLIREVGK